MLVSKDLRSWSKVPVHRNDHIDGRGEEEEGKEGRGGGGGGGGGENHSIMTTTRGDGDGDGYVVGKEPVIEALFTRDYNMIGEGNERYAGVHGGFLVIRPNERAFRVSLFFSLFSFQKKRRGKE